LEATVVEYWPAAQELHKALPVVFLNFPASHIIQLTSSVLVYPVLQSQLLNTPLPGGDCELLWHRVHVASPVAEYVFSGHIVQSAIESEPITFEK